MTGLRRIEHNSTVLANAIGAALEREPINVVASALSKMVANLVLLGQRENRDDDLLVAFTDLVKAELGSKLINLVAAARQSRFHTEVIRLGDQEHAQEPVLAE